MLNDADISRFHHVYVFVGKTDLRKGIDGLSTLVNKSSIWILFMQEICSCSVVPVTGR